MKRQKIQQAKQIGFVVVEKQVEVGCWWQQAKSAFVDWWGKRRGISVEKHSAYELFRFLVLSTFATSSQPILNEQTISPTG